VSTLSIQGRIAVIGQPERKTEKLLIQEMVIETQEQYPQLVQIQFMNDRADLIANFDVGEMVEVFFDIRGRKWQEKYFVSLNGWKIAAVGNTAPAPAPVAPPAAPTPAQAPSFDEVIGNSDDLPF